MAEQYIVSARKYRPETFASIVGQSAMATTLRTAVLSGRMAHAYLFCGPRGVGKTTAARVLAKTINCLSPTEQGEACNECESCKAFNEGRSFNIFELDAASNNSVEDIRTLIDQVAIAPVLGRYKVYIIDEVHMLSQAAFNAFLKTLEEPPTYAIFILATTEKHKILPTILSRCQIYDFKRITVADIAQHLRFVADSEGITAEDAALGLIAEKADGGMRDALSMFDRVASYGQGAIVYQQALDCLNILDHSYYERFIRAFVTADYRQVLLVLDEVLTKGFDGQLVMAGLAAFARDLLVVQHADTLPLLERPETVLSLYQEVAQLVTPAALHQIIRMLVEADSKYRASSNKRLLIELTLLNILTAFSPKALGETAQVMPAPVHIVSPQQPVAQVEQVPQVISPSVEVSKEEASTPATTTREVSTSPASKVPISVRPNQQEQIRQTRRNFRQRNKTQEDMPTEEAPLEEEHTPFTEEDVRVVYLRYVDQSIPASQLILKTAFSNTLPILENDSQVVIPLANTLALIEPAEATLPSLQRYLQTELKNTDLRLSLRLADVEQTFVPVTNREKFEALQSAYPIAAQLRERLNLRII